MRRLQFDSPTSKQNDESSPVLQKLLDKIRSSEDHHKHIDGFYGSLSDASGEKNSNLWCRAFLQPYTTGQTTSVSLVIECTTDIMTSFVGGKGNVIGSNVHPYIVRKGTLKLSLKSSLLEADEANGEDCGLCKMEPFHGNNFEKQFALKIKGTNQLRGIIGKVIIEQITDSGVCNKVGDFNLSYMPKKLKTSDEDDMWLTLGYKELLESLGISPVSTPTESFYNELGFTKHEINALQSAPDSFNAMLKQFKRRRGTAEEFMQKLYSCKRKQNLEPVINGVSGISELPLTAQISDTSTATVHVSQETEELTEACLLLTPPPTPRKRGMKDTKTGSKKPKLRLDFHPSLETIDDPDADAETIPADDIEVHVFPPTPRKFEDPMSPPLTPLKRLTSSTREQHRRFFNNNNDIFVFPDK